jgi:putative ABC transport system substrate-binding protein
MATILSASPAICQPEKTTFRIGMFTTGVNPRSFTLAYEERLRELGYIDGRNLQIEWRQAQGADRAANIAAEMVRLNVDAILSFGGEASLRAMREATRTVPIVMVALNFDPVAKGYVRSLARPGGNVTGIFTQQPEQDVKRLELLREVFPTAKRLAVWSDGFVGDQIKSVQAAAQAQNLRLQIVQLSPPYDLEKAFLAVKRGGAAGFLVVGSPVATRERARLAELALKHRVPAIGPVGYGLLLGYGADLAPILRRAAEMTDRILKGAQPSELPVEQPTKFELVVNLKTAGALGVTIPQALLSRADRIIE